MKSRGFTLVEIVIVISIVVVCGVVIADLFIGQNRLYKVETAELNVTSDARVALDDIDNYVRQANRVLDNSGAYITGAQVLVLQIQSINASNQLIPATFDNVVYYLTGPELYREVFPHNASSRLGGTKQLASHVNGLAFTYNNVSNALVTEVSTNITTQEDAGIQTRAITISSKSTLRNY
ncbi:MAG: hypothetical protein A3I07_02680 [Candidatus Doudnabacteria bacterium RIFCSPLOWO2_02_FULL_42_9]|uniref:Prepilin-type N-terminal cleavage/methylation domain-containing protein n=1 Tax=Candidatus Doudnabacteria bacterium RIFCSPHIGHO2_01_FULL_41_86 TaxID=1817821 RepID=A0A1F5N9U6_9BACT|nr:MAG: hypothetical protein A2717_02210 [Candidatus Doudnabacteria bacterium RIFCSPHIGHO2_01_FULL_41_86]OGE85371.1 MAG: hypothetical protein A3E28_01780 [Candidatus Doudnabacteria bacterium RIFCSPHIGHO2_12_FULL_42_22]OGE86909.1 MAG: hypothetical protein A3C49_02615 [Candidatus Doudnabacteria bacterium RIFCSPHIGHO2_02_FULL_42_25]OGE92508.1 MAG: hypothetical protein A2895_02770 [Candidatus Doudnabacteria bacterium RIFCSPLOWO2_01_FULL_42_60]OGE93020.1 MAG: hypothetical protein A3K08_00215 [Candid